MTLGSLASPAQPGLATRKGIAWALNPPSEDSSVLVLTTPSKNYIDIRFALDGESTQGPFWAFAGTAKYNPLFASSSDNDTASQGVSSGWGEAIRGEWAHPIDSMGNFDGVDKADIFILANGVDQIETGVLENPDNGKEEQFKEYWTKPEDAETLYPVVRAEYVENGVVKGSVIRVGKWCQAIRQVDDTTVTAIRSRLVDGKWKTDEKSSSEDMGSLPVDWVLQDGRAEGDKTEVAGREWMIAEVVSGP